MKNGGWLSEEDAEVAVLLQRGEATFWGGDERGKPA